MEKESGSSTWQRAIKDGKLWTEAEAREALEACASSGESIWVFARRHGVVPERLYRWKRRLRKKSPRPKRNREPRLIPVTVRPSLLEAAMDDRVVVVAGKLRVEVGSSAVSPDWVAALLRLAGEGGS